MLHVDSSLRKRRFALSIPESALVAVTAVWGATFVVVAKAMETSGPMWFVGVRFLFGGALACAIFHRKLIGLTKLDVAAGAAIGVMITIGYGLQTYGLQTINASTSAFVSALYVPLVPLLVWAVLRKAPRTTTLAGIGLAFLGLVLIAGPSAAGIGLGRGEIATLVAALAMAAEIVLIGAFAGKVNLGRVTLVQLLVAGAVALAAMPITGEHVPAFSWWWLGGALGMGTASCLIQLTMNWAQRSVDSTRATIIYSGEPVWGGIFGRLAGDRLPPLAFLGAALILAGVIVSELKPRRTPVLEPVDDEPVPVSTREPA